MFQPKPMKLSHIYLLIIFLSTTTAATEPISSYAKPGCEEKCGNLTIPYPFGIGPDCFLNKWYAVECKSSKAYLSALKSLPLLGLDLNEQTVLVNVPIFSDCQAPIWNSSQILYLGDSPFMYSKFGNNLLFEGCGTAAISSRGKMITGCIATCSRSQPYVHLRGNNCTYDKGNCCQTNVPYYLEDYTMNVTSCNNTCFSAFLVADSSVVESLVRGQSYVIDSSSIPTVFTWRLRENDFSKANCDYNYSQLKLELDDHTLVTSGKCSCPFEYNEGNPYLSGGCKVTEECQRCMDTSGSCVDKVSYSGRVTFHCEHNFSRRGRKLSSHRAIFLGLGISMLVLLLTALGIALYKITQRAKDKKQKKIFFERNGGLLLKQQEAGNEGLTGKTKLFTSNELKKATNCFNENTVIGRGGQGTVHKGTLRDGKIVAIKKAKEIDRGRLAEFINEVVVLSQVNHRNVVKLLGCCLETDVPILVSEFIPNGTLYEHIHHEKTDVFISLNTRLQIAMDVAGAMSYLHSAVSIPIYHRDIKSTNILLDEEYRAKISDFGISRFISNDVSHLTTVVQGTVGYLDPEYCESSQFTEKSDVYSFGVVLVELLTGEKPICLNRLSENKSLASHFMVNFEEGRVTSVLDANMLREDGSDVLLEVANLAMRCLNFCGKSRPTMKEVALELERIKMSHM